MRKVADLDVAAEFGLRVPRRGVGRAHPGGGCHALAFRPCAGSADRAGRVRVAWSTPRPSPSRRELLTKKIASQRQAIDKEKFPEAEKLLAQIEKKSQDLAKAPPSRKDKLMVELNTLTDALKDRQKQLGSPEQVNRQLQQLKDMASQGPADQFVKDLAHGDFKKAAEQLQKLQEKLASGKMTEAEKKALEGAARRDVQEAERARQPRAAEKAARRSPQERRPDRAAIQARDGQAATSSPRA